MHRLEYKDFVKKLEIPPNCRFFQWNEEDGEIDFLLPRYGESTLSIGISENTCEIVDGMREIIASVALRYWKIELVGKNSVPEIAKVQTQICLWNQFGGIQ